MRTRGAKPRSVRCVHDKVVGTLSRMVLIVDCSLDR